MKNPIYNQLMQVFSVYFDCTIRNNCTSKPNSVHFKYN